MALQDSQEQVCQALEIVNDANPVDKLEKRVAAVYSSAVESFTLKHNCSCCRSCTGKASRYRLVWEVQLLTQLLFELYRRKFLPSHELASAKCLQFFDAVEREARRQSIEAFLQRLNDRVWERNVLRMTLIFHLERDNNNYCRHKMFNLANEEYLGNGRCWEDRVLALVRPLYEAQSLKYSQNLETAYTLGLPYVRGKWISDEFEEMELFLGVAQDVEDAARMASNLMPRIPTSSPTSSHCSLNSRFSRRNILNLARGTMENKERYVRRDLLWAEFRSMATAGVSTPHVDIIASQQFDKMAAAK